MLIYLDVFCPDILQTHWHSSEVLGMGDMFPRHGFRISSFSYSIEINSASVASGRIKEIPCPVGREPVPFITLVCSCTSAWILPSSCVTSLGFNRLIDQESIRRLWGIFSQRKSNEARASLADSLPKAPC